MTDQVRQIKESVDIASVIGSRVELKRAGKQLKGLCPFHAERSPSFYVTTDMGMYKCFGCGASGDVYTFLQEYEGMTFREALETLAEIAGIKLNPYKSDQQEDTLAVLKEILNVAGEFYHYLLAKHEIGKAARTYLKQRQIPWTLVEQFNLGYAPESWDNAQRYLVGKKGYSAKDVEAVGLAIAGNRGHYDRFRNRIMFPLTDFRGQVVGFSGRLLQDQAKEAKYINTPETQLYHKRQLLFGLHQARAAIRKKDQVVVVEGEFDVLSSVAAGVYQTVAIKGSALTTEHVQLINRLTRNITLCLDADTAGDAATKKGIELADSYGMNVSVITISNGKDPDDLARHQPQEWKNLVKAPESVYQFYIANAFNTYDSQSGVGKKEISKVLVPVLSGINNAVEQAHYVDKVAKKLQVNPTILQAEIEKHQRALKLPLATQPKPSETSLEAMTSLEKLERQIWSLWLALPEPQDQTQVVRDLHQFDWDHPGLKRLAQHLESWLSKKTFSLKTFLQQLPEELQQLLGQLYLDTDTSQNQLTITIGTIRDIMAQARTLQIKKRIHQLTQDIASLEVLTELSSGQQQQLAKMQQQVSGLIQQLRHD